MLYNREAVYYPIGQLTDAGPYRFSIPSENGLMLDCSSIRLEGRIELWKWENNAYKRLVADESVMLTNMYPSALFR